MLKPTEWELHADDSTRCDSSIRATTPFSQLHEVRSTAVEFGIMRSSAPDETISARNADVDSCAGRPHLRRERQVALSRATGTVSLNLSLRWPLQEGYRLFFSWRHSHWRIVEARR